MAAETVRQSTTWTITIHPNRNFSKIDGYTVERNDSSKTGCEYDNYAYDASTLWVCEGDTVRWLAATMGDNDGNVKNDIYITIPDPILLEGHVVHGSDGVPAGGKIDKKSRKDPYEYHVFVIDKMNGKKYCEDPKIRIGTGTLYDLIEYIHELCERLRVLAKTSNDKAITKGICECAKEQEPKPRPPK